jgi:hypothetical protein
VLSPDNVWKKDGRRLDRFHVIICVIAINCNCNSLFTSFLSHQVSIFTHMHSVHFSALSMHYPQCKALPVRTRKCRLLHHGYNAVADDSWADSHLVPRILHWHLTEEVEKVEKGQILWIHTYRRTSYRPRGDVCKVWLRSVQKCGFV